MCTSRRRVDESELQRHSFLTSQIDGFEWLASGPDRFVQEKIPRIRWLRKNTPSGRCGNKKYDFFLPGIEAQRRRCPSKA